MNRLTNSFNSDSDGPDVLLCDEPVGGAAFDRFDRWIDAQLELLVARWQASAAPCAHARTTGLLNKVTPPSSR